MKHWKILAGLTLTFALAACNTQIPAAPQETASHQVTPQLINGTNSSLQDVPWAAAIGFELYPGNWYWLCQGTVIGKRWVITSADCISPGPSVLWVAYNTTSIYSGMPAQKAKRVIRHPNYKKYSTTTNGRTGGLNNLALIELGKDIPGNSFATLPPLASADLYQTEPYLNVFSFARKRLQHIYAPPRTQADCQSELGNWAGRTIQNTEFCVGPELARWGNPTRSVRDGHEQDSGTGATAGGTLWGVLNWGSTSATVQKPAAFTNVALHQPWITSVTSIQPQ